MEFTDWRKLLYGIEQDKCILLLGPGLPQGRDAPETAMQDLADMLLTRLSELGGDTSEIDSRAIGAIATRYLFADDELGLAEQIESWHVKLQARRSETHEILATLPFTTIVTSAFDPLMENALRERGKNPTVGYYHHRGGFVELLSSAPPTPQRPWLYYLRGHASDPDSLVLTDTQLLDHLTALIAKAPDLPRDLSAALSECPLFLFLGFGLERWHLRMLLYVLKVLRRGGRRFAIEAVDQIDNRRLRDAILFYRDFKLDIYCQDALEFLGELQKRCESIEAARRADGPSSDSPPQDPSVFLCHAHEDADKALEIRRHLIEAGIQPWLDSEELRGGDEWDDRIEKTVPALRYFVLLHSRNLVKKTRGAHYLNKEIKVAERSADWRLGRFIIPVLLDDAPLLDRFGKFHAIDLRTPRGLTDLIRAIKRQEALA